MEIPADQSSASEQKSLMQATELLWIKQNQLEGLAGEKAALQLSLERAVAAARDDAERVKR